MKNKYTFTIIKPDAMKNKFMGKIIDMILAADFQIVSMKLVHLTADQAQEFYLIHKNKGFFQELVQFMTSAPVCMAVLKKDNAVEAFRKLIGNTDPQKAKDNTIRKAFARSIGENAIHGSDSNESAMIESNLFFSQKEYFE